MTRSGGLPGKLNLQQLFLTLSDRPFVQSQDAGWSIHPRVIHDYDLFICTGGAAEFHIAGERYLLTAGHALLVPPDTVFSAEFKGPGNFEAVAQHFTLQILGGSDLFSLIEYTPIARFHEEWAKVSEDLSEYLRATGNSGSALACESRFLLLLDAFLRHAWRGDRAATEETRLFVVEIAYLLRTRFTDEHVLSRAAELSPVSWDYTARLFKEHMGLTPKQFLIRQRLMAARDMLTRGYSVKHTARTTGFRDELYFSRLFRRRTGVPPSRYTGGV